MEKKRASNFFWLVTAFILGKALYNQFDFETLKFDKVALSMLYLVVFATAVYFIVRNLVNRLRK